MQKQAIKSLEMLDGQRLGTLENIDHLNGEERSAVLDAIAEAKKSQNIEFRAGATAVAMDGTKVALHNDKTEPGTGQQGHAEMLALSALYRVVKPSEKKLKFLALAAAAPGEDVVREGMEPYASDTPFEEMEFERPCGRCLKFLSDYTGNFISAETGKPDPQADIGILLVTKTGQIIRTSLKRLHPLPHLPRRIDIAPLGQHARGASDSESGK